jgi:phosphate/sulfate permease
VILFVLLGSVSGYVVLIGLIAPWSGAPVGTTMTLVAGGLGLAGIAAAGAFTAVERGGLPLAWAVRWGTLAVVVLAIAAAFYLYG